MSKHIDDCIESVIARRLNRFAFLKKIMKGKMDAGVYYFSMYDSRQKRISREVSLIKDVHL